MAEEGYSEGIVRAYKSHVERSREGRELLKRGVPLSEMKTPIEGATPGQLTASRQTYLDRLEGMSHEQLKTHLGKVEKQIGRLLDTDLVGTSELEWRRNVIKARFPDNKKT